MNISLIAAMDRNNAIGYGNTLPWHVPTDMQHFRKTTTSKSILMGRNTFDSMGRALPKRTNIVLSRNPRWKAEGTYRVGSIEEAYTVAQQHNPDDELWVIGGSQVYELALPLASTLVLTRLDMALVQADAYFPKFSNEHWELIESRAHEDETSGFALSIETWKRINR